MRSPSIEIITFLENMRRAGISADMILRAVKSWMHEYRIMLKAEGWYQAEEIPEGREFIRFVADETGEEEYWLQDPATADRITKRELELTNSYRERKSRGVTNGLGKYYTPKCPECGHTTEVLNVCTKSPFYWKDCPECEGDGGISIRGEASSRTCPTCKGEGKVEGMKSVIICKDENCKYYEYTKKTWSEIAIKATDDVEDEAMRRK